MNAIRQLHDQWRQGVSHDVPNELFNTLEQSGLELVDLEAVLTALTVAWKAYLATKSSDNGTLFCSFCHRSQSEVQILVVATNAAICDQCSQIVQDILAPTPSAAKRTLFAFLRG